MNVETYFREMYFNIWQNNDISKLDFYYARDFAEIISVSNHHQEPIEIKMSYDDIQKQVKWQKANYKDTTINIKKIVANDDLHISVYFHSTSIAIKTNALKHRLVCGIWRINKYHQIDRVWAVVTPYYTA